MERSNQTFRPRVALARTTFLTSMAWSEDLDRRGAGPFGCQSLRVFRVQLFARPTACQQSAPLPKPRVALTNPNIMPGQIFTRQYCAKVGLRPAPNGARWPPPALPLGVL
jgi:hypothetical protein